MFFSRRTKKARSSVSRKKTPIIKPLSEGERRKRVLYRRVPIWNHQEERVIVGEEAPIRRNLIRYLKIYPFCDVYAGQDQLGHFKSITKIITDMGLDPNERVVIWDMHVNQMIRGTKAPTRKELSNFLYRHPYCVEFVPWETRVSRKIAEVRRRWLREVRGTSYLYGKAIRPTVSEEDRAELNLSLSLNLRRRYG